MGLAPEYAASAAVANARRTHDIATVKHASNTLPGGDLARTVLVTGDGDLVVRVVDDSVDRTWAVVAGQQIVGFLISHVRATSTATGTLGV